MTNENKKNERIYFIDWLRVIAIGILLVFHIMIMYQSYAIHIQFIQSPVLIQEFMLPLSFFSVIRIPLLFFVSGMGVYFSLKRRNWIQLLIERTKRILIPLIFGSLAIVPIHKYIYSEFQSELFNYSFDFSHLWFLMNIYLYVLWFLAIFYFAKQVEDSKFVVLLRHLINKNPIYVYLLTIPYIIQSFTIPAEIPYTLYFDSRVGLLLGAVAFLLGFTFMTLGEVVWRAISKLKFYTLGLSIIIFIIRFFVFEGNVPHFITAIESISWVITAFGIGHRFLNQPSKTLNYLSSSAYPIYIVHMVFMYLGAYLIFPLNLGGWISFLLITIFTFLGCFITYEVIRRIFFLRPLFGLKKEVTQVSL